MANIAPGFMDLEALFARRVKEVGYEVINDAVEQSAQLFAAEQDALLSAVAEAINPKKPQMLFRLPVTVEMQPLQGEDDSPVPVQGFDEYQLAFPLFDVGLAWGNNRKSRVKITVAEANEFTLNALQADARWHRRQMLTALLNNTSYTFSDKEWGTLTVKPLANGDSDKYTTTNGSTATDNHYLAQANPISDTDYPFGDIADELTEHPDNRGDVVVYVARNLRSSVRALADFIPFAANPNIQPGISADTLTDFPDVPFGERRLGYLDEAGVYVVQWNALPDNYMLAITTENSRRVLGYRDEPEPELQGLRIEVASFDGNHIVQRLLRTRGFAVQNRVAAVCFYVGNATYQVPSGYSVPQL